MNKSTISAQLQHDYPDYQIHLDARRRMLVADNHKMCLLNSPSALETMNIFSRSGKSFYQAITQLLCSNYDVLPREGSYASTLIILKEDLHRYKIQKLAKEWGIGFLEDDKNVLAVEVDDGIEKHLFLEHNEVIGELYDAEKGIEFASSIEEIETADEAIRNKIEDREGIEQKLKILNTESIGRLNFIQRILNRRWK